MCLYLSKCHIVGNRVSQLKYSEGLRLVLTLSVLKISVSERKEDKQIKTTKYTRSDEVTFRA